MFKYVGDISELAHKIILSNLDNFSISVDATLGNGHDTDFLSSNFNKVYAFDIQEKAIENYKHKKKDNTILICDSHDKLGLYVKEKVDCIMYNLGFLPGGDKKITTKVDTTIKSIKEGLKYLNYGSIMSIAIYVGHDEGKKERDAIINEVKNLPKNEYGVLMHSFLNRSSSAPLLIIIEKIHKMP